MRINLRNNKSGFYHSNYICLVSDDHTMMCDFDGSQCTLMQVIAEDQADWNVVKALETRDYPPTVDHTTDTGNMTKTKRTTESQEKLTFNIYLCIFNLCLPWTNFPEEKESKANGKTQRELRTDQFNVPKFSSSWCGRKFIEGTFIPDKCPAFSCENFYPYCKTNSLVIFLQVTVTCTICLRRTCILDLQPDCTRLTEGQVGSVSSSSTFYAAPTKRLSKWCPSVWNFYRFWRRNGYTFFCSSGFYTWKQDM